jgi:hypothetical protein
MDRARFESAQTFEQYLSSVVKNRELWHAVWERVRLPAELIAEARLRSDVWRLAAVTEDWCGDAVNTLPAVARLAEEAGWEFRCFARDANPDIMDGHLTNGRSRSIPIVIVYDADFEEIGWWGPRPREIQVWVMTEGLAMPSPERYKVIRRWYAQDRGRTTLEELLDIIPPR